MPNEFVARNGLIAQNNSIITGSLNITAGITGSLQGTASFASTASYITSSAITGTVTSASYALTASYAMNGGSGGGTTNTGSLLTTASVSSNTITFTKGDGSTFPITVNTGSGGGGGGPAFPYTGSAGISGSLTVNGTTTIIGPWDSNFTNGLHFSFASNTGSIYSIQNGTAWRRLDIEGDPIVMGWQSAGKIGLGIESPTSKLHVYDPGNTKIAHFEGANGSPLQIVTSDESLQGGYTATQGSIGIGSDRLQIKYGNSNDTQWADAAYNLYTGSIDLNTAYYITYPGTYEVTVGTATGGNAIYLPAFNAWTYGAKVTIINATDEYISVNTQLSENRYLEGTTNNISVISPRSINEYVSTASDWRILPSMKQITYTGIDLSGGDYNIYTKGVYKITVGSGDNLIFPNPANFEGETITVINTDTISVNIDNNGNRPLYVDGTAYASLDAQSIYQFVCIDGNWRVVSLIVA